MTGCSPTQVGSDKTQKKFFGMAQALDSALRAMGHEVDWRRPEFEDIHNPDYDLIIAGIACIASMGGRYSNYIYSWIGMRAAGQDIRPLIVYMDDWHMKPLMSTIGSIMREPQRIHMKAEALNRPTLGWLKTEGNDQLVLEGVKAIDRGDWPPFILHRFPWGDESVMTTLGRIKDPWSMDPSGFMPQHPIEPPDERLLEWTCPRLQTLYDAWLTEVEASVSWPVTRFGNQRMQEQVVPESKIPQIICEAAGTLVPGGTHSGSGLWRSRYLMAAWTNTPFYAAPEEVVGTLDPVLATPPQAIEAMSQRDRDQLAKAQGQAILSRVWTRQGMVDRLQFLLSTVLKTDLGLAPRVADTDVLEPKPVFVPPPLLRSPTTAVQPAPVKEPRAPREPKAPREPRPPREPRQPRPCACATWVRTPEMGEDIRGHHPTCPRVQPMTVVGRKTRDWSHHVPKDQIDNSVTEVDPSTGLLVRTHRGDAWGIIEVPQYKRVGIKAGDTVLDLGGHIGSFTHLAAEAGAGHIVVVEPEPTNLVILAQNVQRTVDRFGTNIELIPGAVVNVANGPVTLYVNEGRGSGTHSLEAWRGRIPVEVPSVGFRELMEKYQPRVMKVDVEGAELDWDWSDLPSCVKAICMEIHLMRHALWLPKAQALVDQLHAQGFTDIKSANLQTGRSTCTGIWSRP